MAFTDVGCDQGEMIAFVALGGGVQSAWGVEIQPGPEDPEKPTSRGDRMKKREGGGTPGIEQLFLLTAGTLNFLQPPVHVAAAFSSNLGTNPKVNIYPPEWGMKPTEERRAVYSFDVG